MTKSERAIAVKKILDKTYPKTPVPLKHKDNFSLLVAVLLSAQCTDCLLYTSPSPRDVEESRMPSSA